MKDTIVLHHTANQSSKSQADSVINQHLKEFGQAGAYHYLIESDGRPVQFHEEDFTGYHAGNYLMNVRSIGICLAGDFTRHVPTGSQIGSLVRLVTDIQTRWGIPDERILLHREVKGTACPGTDLRAELFSVRDKLMRQEIVKLQKAHERATGSRKEKIARLLVRLMRLFP